MSDSVVVGQRWRRNSDDRILEVEVTDGGAHLWLYGYLDNGRVITISEAGLRSKYTLIEDGS